MAAEVVICKNLARIFEQNKQLIRKFHRLDNWEDSVEKAESVMAALIENNDLGGLLYKADDLLDEILTFINGRTGFRAARQEYDDSGGYLRGVKKTIENATCRITQEVNLFFSSHNQLVFPLTRKTRQLAWTSQKIKACAEQLLNVVATIDHREREFEAPQNVILSENRVLGRDVDKRKIIAMLLRPEKRDTDVSMMHILGIPGVGKSNVAKYVYDDEEIDNHFDLKIWIRVSTISDKEIIRQIVESCTNRRFNDDLNSRLGKSGFGDRLGCRSLGSSVISPREIRTRKDEVNKIFKRRLRKEIKGKLFLLVLDDASIRPWEPLKEVLAGGARGSHILVTPQSVEDSVAVSSQPYQLNSLESRARSHISVTTEPVEKNTYRLNGLEKEASWSLFQTFAFGQEGATPSEFEEIGKSIAENCEGIPLTIKVAASLLHGKSAEDWQSFKDSMLRAQPQGTSIMNQVLDLSYNDLPTRLKACFGYCSLFPEDYNFNKHNLISLWIAQGYVDGQNLEETAEKYFLHLLRRCFFEYVSTDDLGNIVTCKMHRIMHTLACQHAPGVLNSYMVDSSVNEKIPSKHISFICVENSSTKIAPDLLKTRSLRTLLSVKEPHCNTTMDKSVSDTLIASFKCLRVLDLHDLGIQELPVSIGKLIHLRYLDLSKNGLLTLPKSVTELYSLQTLILNSCMKLKRIHGNYGQLINLTRFEIDECYSLTCMPTGLERLIQLQTLSRFIVHKQSSSELKTLNRLRHLRGRLTIELSGDWAINIPKAQVADLQGKTQLKELKIRWTETVSEKSSYKQLLEQLQPNSNLKILCIEGYKGEDLPTWAGVNQLAISLPNLVVISIEGCGQCDHLPPFGVLPLLKRLTLRHMANVQYVQKETRPSNQEPPPYFQSLEELTLHNFYKLEGMVTPENTIPSFPCLSVVRIWNCPKLQSMPLLTEVTDLDLCNVNLMLLEKFARNEAMNANSNTNIQCLKIKGCHSLKSFKAVKEGLGGLSSLKQLVIEKCHTLSSLASELSNLTSLRKLEISSCKELDLSNDDIDTWASLRSLQQLTLRELPKMEFLPEGMQHVQHLRSLWISACTAFKALPQWIANLRALQHLRIESCEALTRLPDELVHIRSLEKVEITECPKLMERCREHTGEDWPKIKHARVLLHKSWRYGLMSELGASENRSNVRALNDIKYIIIPVIAAVQQS